MPGHIQGERSVFEVFLSRCLGHVQVHCSVRGRTFDIEVHVQVFHTSLIRLNSAGNCPVPRPATVRRFAVSGDLTLRVHAFPGQDLNAFGIFANAVCCAIEDGSLAICAENFEVEDCEHARSCGDADND